MNNGESATGLSAVTHAVIVATLTGVVCFACADSIPAGEPQLSVRNGHTLAYDEADGRVVLFGGADASQVRGDTWQWDSDRRSWRSVAAVGPDARTFPSMVYDERRGEILLFGGNRVLFGKDGELNTFLADTWTLRRSHWTARPVQGPDARAEAAIAYDRDRARVVLFGGYRRTLAGTIRLGDTWEWNGHSWSQVSTVGPSPRNGAAMAYDERRRVTVLFGGSGASSETWEWDGALWKPMPATAPPGRFNPAMTYDVRASMVVRFGGWTGKERAADLWALTAGGWSPWSSVGPAARNHSSMTFNRARNTAMLFGGHDGDRVFGDTWEWANNVWTLVSDQPPQMRVSNGH